MKTHDRPPPLTPPAWLTPQRLALGAIAVAGATAATPALARVDAGLARETAPSLIVCTTVLSVLLARRALRARSPEGAGFTSMLGGAVAGALNAGLVLCAQLIGEGKGAGALLGLLAGTLIGSVIGGPLGFAFGIAYSPVLAATVRARNTPTLDALEPVLLASGAFLALVGAFVGWHHAMPYRYVGLALVIGGFACAVLSFTRDVARLAWMRAVRAGRLREYEIVARTEDMHLAGLLPVFRSPGAMPEGVLTRVRLEGTPFRSMTDRVPLARVHLRAEDERPVARRRIALSLIVMALAGACAASPYMSSRAPGDMGLIRGFGSMD